MDKNTENTIYNLKKIHLEKDEKDALRARLLSEIHKTPFQSPYKNNNQWSILLHQNLSKKMLTVFACLVLLVTFSSVTFASESSLPGDMLYTIKTKINEPILRAVKAVTPAKSVNFETQIFEKRLIEAEELDQKGHLNEEKKKQIKTQLTDQNDRLENAVEQLVNTNKEKKERKNNREKENVKKNIEEQEDKETDDAIKHIDTVFTKHQEVIEKIDKKISNRKNRKNQE